MQENKILIFSSSVSFQGKNDPFMYLERVCSCPLVSTSTMTYSFLHPTTSFGPLPKTREDPGEDIFTNWWYSPKIDEEVSKPWRHPKPTSPNPAIKYATPFIQDTKSFLVIKVSATNFVTRKNANPSHNWKTPLPCPTNHNPPWLDWEQTFNALLLHLCRNNNIPRCEAAPLFRKAEAVRRSQGGSRQFRRQFRRREDGPRWFLRWVWRFVPKVALVWREVGRPDGGSWRWWGWGKFSQDCWGFVGLAQCAPVAAFLELFTCSSFGCCQEELLCLLLCSIALARHAWKKIIASSRHASECWAQVQFCTGVSAYQLWTFRREQNYDRTPLLHVLNVARTSTWSLPQSVCRSRENETAFRVNMAVQSVHLYPNIIKELFLVK